MSSSGTVVEVDTLTMSLCIVGLGRVVSIGWVAEFGTVLKEGSALVAEFGTELLGRLTVGPSGGCGC